MFLMRSQRKRSVYALGDLCNYPHSVAFGLQLPYSRRLDSPPFDRGVDRPGL